MRTSNISCAGIGKKLGGLVILAAALGLTATPLLAQSANSTSTEWAVPLQEVEQEDGDVESSGIDGNPYLMIPNDAATSGLDRPQYSGKADESPTSGGPQNSAVPDLGPPRNTELTIEDLTPAERAVLDQVIAEYIRKQEGKKKQQEEEKKHKAEEEGYVIGSDLSIKASWRNGVYFESPHRDFIFHFGGAFQDDLALYSINPSVEFGPRGTGPFLDGTNIRRGRLRGEGSLYQVVDFLMELEFFNGVEVTGANIDEAPTRTFLSPGPTDFNATLRYLPLIGNFRIGNMKEPFSLEHLNSYRYLEFMERSYLFDAFMPTAFNNGFTPGIMIFNTLFDEHATWWLGAFKNDDTLFGFGLGDGQYAVTGRLTGLPVYENDGRLMVHFGAAASHRDPVRDVVRARVRDAVRNAPFPLLPLLADTGLVFASSQSLINLEHAMVMGPFTVQAEYTCSFLHDAQLEDGTPIGTFFTHGAYFEVLCFLTGEHRPWDRRSATFGRVIPHENFFWVPNCGQKWICGSGAWEVGVRYTWLDLTNSGIFGGVLNDITLGLNWYLNPNAKLQWNYDLAHRGDLNAPSDGWIQAFGMRVALDF